jgi:hypothetical protein
LLIFLQYSQKIQKTTKNPQKSSKNLKKSSKNLKKILNHNFSYATEETKFSSKLSSINGRLKDNKYLYPITFHRAKTKRQFNVRTEVSRGIFYLQISDISEIISDIS